MNDRDYITRRDFAKLALGATAIPIATRSMMTNKLRSRPDGHMWPGYDEAIVIDCLASPGPFNVPNRTGSPLSEVMIENARSSGITAVNVTVSGGGAGHESFDSTVREISYWERELAEHSDILTKVLTVQDLREAKRHQKLGLIYGFQDATMLEGQLDKIELFYNLGTRIIQLTYNVRNRLGDGCLEPANGGLSKFGHEVVEQMNATGMLVDLSHCGQQTTADSIGISTLPVAATHSGCNTIFEHPRNKNDRELRNMAEKGGVIGIYMMPFLNAEGPASMEHFIQHVEHAINTCGEEHVGVGSDNSITPTVADQTYRDTLQAFASERQRLGIGAPREYELLFVTDLNHPRRMEMLADALLARGHGEARVEKVIGANFLRLFDEVWR